MILVFPMRMLWVTKKGLVVDDKAKQKNWMDAALLAAAT